MDNEKNKNIIAIIVALLSILNSIKSVNNRFELNIISLALLILALLIHFLDKSTVIKLLSRVKKVEVAGNSIEFAISEEKLDTAIRCQKISQQKHPTIANFAAKSTFTANAEIIKGPRSKIIEVLKRPEYKWYTKEIIISDTGLDEITVNLELSNLIKENIVIAGIGVSGERIFGLTERINEKV